MDKISIEIGYIIIFVIFEQFAHLNFIVYSYSEKDNEKKRRTSLLKNHLIPVGLVFRVGYQLVGVISDHSSASLISFTHSILAA